MKTHLNVVQVLNPEVRAEAELMQRMHSLNEELKEAHKEVHSSEDLLNQTIQELKEVEEILNKLQVATTAAPATAPAIPAEPIIPTVTTAPSTAPPSPKTRKLKDTNGLKSTLELEPELKNFWYPVEFTAKLEEDTILPLELFGESWVMFRDAEGKASCLRDECAHRACPLSLGELKGGNLTCAYHGWEFNGKGQCENMPSTKMCKGVGVKSLPLAETDGLIFVWTGDGEPDIPLPNLAAPSGFTIHSELVLEVPVEHGLLIENLLDLAHAPFTHTATFARGWPIPEVVRFHLQEKLGGNWDPYPIDMSFHPPCMTESKIGLNQPGKIERGLRCDECAKHLHQLHVCLPAKEGHTRLLYRMSLDFLDWVRFVPGIDILWKAVANQVLSEDLRLVLGQQARILAGGDTWAFPVPYDKLAVRYRRWRNNLGGNLGAERATDVKMTAGEMFTETEAESTLVKN
jgi:chlorophyllide a oxygenase